MEKLYRIIKDGIDMTYGIMTPDDYNAKDKYPLLVALHGAGTFGTEPEVVFDSAAATAFRKYKHKAVLLLPHSPYATWSSQIRNLKYVIDLASDRFNIDTARISIAGESMGGFGAWDMITEYPDFFAAAAPICGGGRAWAAPGITELPIWIYHGDKDDLVIPERSDEMYEKLKSFGHNNELHYSRLPGVDHNAWDKAYIEDDIISWLISHKKKVYDVYVASPVSDGGIYRYKLKNGELIFCEKYDEAGVSYLNITRGKLYATLNQSGTNIGGIVSYDLDRERLTGRSAVLGSNGNSCCHLDIDNDGNIYAVNYLTGNVIKTSFKTGVTECVQHKGDGINKPRQDKEHTHQVCFTPDGKYFTVCDLGTDTIHVYDFDLREISTVSAVNGSGPRHLIFSDDGKYAYCINELDNTVTVYSYGEGVLTRLGSYDMLPFGYDGLTTAAAIRIRGKYLYASTRGHDSVTRFEILGDELKYVDNTSVHGKRPRDINITPDGKYLMCANEGGNVTVFAVKDDGSLEYTGREYQVPGALCIIFA